MTVKATAASKTHEDIILALRAIREAAWRLDAVVDTIPIPGLAEDMPHKIKILKEAGRHATEALYNAVDVIEERLDLDISIGKGQEGAFDRAFDKVRALKC